MASKTFLLLALAFAIVVLITSEFAVAEELASNHDSEVDGRGGYNRGGHGPYDVGGGRKSYSGGGYNRGRPVCGRRCKGAYDGGRGRRCKGPYCGRGGDHGKGGGGGGGRGSGGKGGCKYGCCSRGAYKHGGCKCCSTFAEATAYKQTQN